MMSVDWGLVSAEASKEEKLEASLPEQFRQEAMEAVEGTPEWDALAQGRYFHYYEAQRRVEQQDTGGLSIYEQMRRLPS